MTLKAQRTLGMFLPLFLCAVLFLAACGGGSRGGGGFVPTPAPAPEEPTLGEVPWQVDPDMARTQIGGAELDLTSEAIRTAATEIVGAEDAAYMKSVSIRFAGEDVMRGLPSCEADTCTTTYGEGAMSESLSGIGFDNPALEYQAVMSRRGVSLTQWRGRGLGEDTTDEVSGYGGWLEHSLFAARTNLIRGGGSAGASSSDSFVIGNPTGTNPTSGSGRWSGVMVGADVSDTDARGHAIQGDAEITLADFLNPMVDVGFFNVFDLAAGMARDDMNWEDIPVMKGSFQSGSGSEQISGQFYGPEHEEVGGVFEWNQILGAFGAKRDPPTSEEIRAIAVGFTDSSDSYLKSDRLSFPTFGGGFPFTRGETSCNADTCTTSVVGGSSKSESLSDLDLFDNPALEYQSVTGRRGVSLAQVSGKEPTFGVFSFDIFGYGGWLEHSFFAVWSRVSKEGSGFGGFGGSAGASTIDSFVLGNATGTNPTSGSGRWSGVMVGADVSATSARGHVIQGEAAITIRDFLNPMVDVGFSNVFDLEAGTSRPDMNWQDISLTSGSFQSGSGSNQISGQFYGLNHEEVGGVFDRNQVIGAFGAKRE